MSKPKRSWMKQAPLMIFSVWIVYHLFIILLMPNGSSHPGRALEPWVRPYASVLGMNTTWNFFSPDPAHTMYLKFTLFFDSEEDDSGEPVVSYLPEKKNVGVWDLSERRQLYAMRYMMLDRRRFEAILGPWLCRTNPGLSEAQIEHIIESIPTLDAASFRRDVDLRDLGQSYDFAREVYRCSQAENEVDL